MKLVRKVHLWLGMLFAPSIMFFAFSGSLQLFGLHEGDGPAWAARLALVHKDQLLHAPTRAPRPPQAEAPTSETVKAVHRDKPQPSMPLKIFFLFMCIGLVTSSSLGIYLAFAYKRERVTILALLGLGLAFPILALFM